MALPAIAALWVVIEWTHSWTGFEWLNLGNAGSNMSLPLRLAPITGVWGLSFVFALMSAAIACDRFSADRVSQILWLLLLPALVFLPDVPAFERGNASAILVQPNIDDEAEWTPELVRSDGAAVHAALAESRAGRDGRRPHRVARNAGAVLRHRPDLHGTASPESRRPRMPPCSPA